MNGIAHSAGGEDFQAAAALVEVETMNVAAGTVSYEGYGKPEQNDQLLKVLEKTLRFASEEDVDLVCFPGGYLSATGEEHRDSLAQQLRDIASAFGLAVAVGVDLSQKNVSQDWTEAVLRNQLPWFAVCWSPVDDCLRCWRQRSSNSYDWRAGSPERYAEIRSLPVRKGTVEILMCGEIFNRKIRENLAGRADAIDVVADLAHTSRGFRAAEGMKAFARGGVASLCSVHTQKRGGRKYRYDPSPFGPVCRSTNRPDIFVEGPPRVELAVWPIP